MLRAFALVAACAVAAARDPLPDMVNALRNEASRIAGTAVPGHVVCPAGGCLLANLQTDGRFRTASVALGNVDQLRGQWSLPDELMNRLRAIVFANSVTFQSFNLVIDVGARNGRFEEYVGVARQYNGNAQVALAYSSATGNLQQQHTQQTQRVCKRCWIFAKCCKNHQITVARGFTHEEIQHISNALRRAAYQRVMGMIQAPPASLFALFQEEGAEAVDVPVQDTFALVADQAGSGSASVFDRLTGGINTITSTWQSVVSAFKTTTSTTIQNTIAGVGWDHLKQSVAVRRITGLRPEALDIVVSRTISDMRIPPQYHEQAKYSLFLVQYADSQEWIKFDMLFNTGSGGETSYVCIMGNNDAATGKTNWVMANMQATFRLAPDVMIIRKSGSYAGGIFENTKDQVKRVPRSLTQADVENVLNIMTGLVLEKMGRALGLSITLPNP